MPWLIGIDEAGYGPNLGPMVQTSASLFVRDGGADVWAALAAAVRRAIDGEDGRLLIDDSKKVHDGPSGFVRLEHGVLAALSEETVMPFALGDLLKACALEESRSDLLREAWFDVRLELPATARLETVLLSGKSLHHSIVQNEIRVGPLRGVVTPTPRFNALLDKWGNKSAVLAAGVISLLQVNRALPGDEPIIFLIDKLGGRHFYAAMIQEAFPDGWVRAEREGPDICSYTILGIDRDIRLVFQPRADGAHLTVALASMAAKYLRELFMRQFNRYWQTHVPGIKPTAGYPSDAGRFMKLIREKVRELGFELDSVWRKK